MPKAVFSCPLLLVLACGSEPGEVGSGSGGQPATGGTSGTTSGGVTSTGGSAGTGGKATTGGNASTTGGNASTTGGNASTTGGNASTTGGNASTTGGTTTSGGSGGAGLVDCDLRKVLCRSVEPVCPANQVPSLSGTCYGPCVPIESCACSAAAECPHNETYTCWQRTHCGPYV